MRHILTTFQVKNNTYPQLVNFLEKIRKIYDDDEATITIIADNDCYLKQLHQFKVRVFVISQYFSGDFFKYLLFSQLINIKNKNYIYISLEQDLSDLRIILNRKIDNKKINLFNGNTDLMRWEGGRFTKIFANYSPTLYNSDKGFNNFFFEIMDHSEIVAFELKNNNKNKKTCHNVTIPKLSSC